MLALYDAKHSFLGLADAQIIGVLVIFSQPVDSHCDILATVPGTIRQVWPKVWNGRGCFSYLNKTLDSPRKRGAAPKARKRRAGYDTSYKRTRCVGTVVGRMHAGHTGTCKPGQLHGPG